MPRSVPFKVDGKVVLLGSSKSISSMVLLMFLAAALPKRTRPPGRGQALVEFALVVMPLLVILMGIMQFGLLFWAQITLTQVGRDTWRWAATQAGCSAATVNLAAQANTIASNSLLVGYGSSNPVSVTGAAWSDGNPASPAPPPVHSCPPPDNKQVWYVTFTLHYAAPAFLPLVPGDGNLSTRVRYRMEPAP